MYNELQKQRYIEMKTELVVVPDYFLSSLFNKCEQFEIEFKKDICNFTLYDIKNFYKSLNTASLESLMVINSTLSQYTVWCLEEGLVKDNMNHFLEVDNVVYDNCLNKILLNKKIITREQMLNWCCQIPNSSDAFIILALFELGKSNNYKTILQLNIRDIDEERHIAHLCDGRNVKISDEFIAYAKDANREDTYYSLNGIGSRPIYLVENGHILKNRPNTKIDTDDFRAGRRFYNQYIKVFEYLGVRYICKGNSIIDSGRIDFINRKSKELNITKKEYIYKYANEITYQFGNSINSTIFYKKYKDYLI